ncbi:MAG: carboxypeptidase regulatory-like domain-containing protein [Acidobacteriia bacterium]|nr:carboxypeptidase regulatory-like domain-containing protein [Terriglobia bacterium]
MSVRCVSAAAGLFMLAVPAFCYHLFYMKNGSIYVPTKWTTTANFTVGSSTGATDITATVAASVNAWKNISTAKSPLGTVTAVAAGVKYNNAVGSFGTTWGVVGDGKGEVVYDQDGSAFAAAGIALITVHDGITYTINGYTPTHKTLVSGAAVIDSGYVLINGTGNSAFDLQAVLTHELGHFQGLAHSAVAMYNSASLVGEFGAVAPGGDVLDPISVTKVPTMHPFSDTGTAERTPEPDDIAAISELYPAATYSTTLGSITGTITRCSTNAAVTGASVRIVNTANTNIQLGRFTGFDGNTTGTYTINGVPPGSYRVLIEGLGANDFTIDRFTTNMSVPIKAENDFPTSYYPTTCGADYNGVPANTAPPTSGATNVSATAGGSASAINFQVGGVDLALVIDNTGSMSNEIAAVRTALSLFISFTQTVLGALGKPFPTVAVVPFVDTASVQVISNNPATLQRVVAAQFASGGGDCPEPSNNALLTAGRLLKNNGVAILFTDADSDYDGPSRATVDTYYRSKGLRLSVLLSGTCSGSVTSSVLTPLVAGSSVAEEYEHSAPLGNVSSLATFSDEALSSGGIFTVNTDIKSGNSTLYTNTATNIANSSVVAAIGLVSPSTLYQGATTILTITGSNTNFTSASVVSFSGSGVTVNSTSVLSATQIQASITVDPAAATGYRNITVTTNLGGSVTETATGTGALQIVAPPASATLTGTTPGVGSQGQTLTVQISATKSHFASGTSTASFGSGVAVNSLTVTSPTAVSASVTISPAATVGYRHVSVTTGVETATDTSNGSFLVASPLSAIAELNSVAPNTGTKGQTGLPITITGQNTHFAAGTSVLNFSNPGITVTSLTVNSTTSASATINIATTAGLGFSDVLMTTGGETATLLSGFQVLTAPPVVQTGITVTASGLAYSRSNQTFNGTVTITNTSGSTVTGPLSVVFTALPAGVTLVNAAGTSGGNPYLPFTGISILQPGQSATVSVQFSDPSNVRIVFTPVVYSGTLVTP